MDGRMVYDTGQMAEGSVSAASDFPVRGVPVHTQMNPFCGRRLATVSPFAEKPRLSVFAGGRGAEHPKCSRSVQW